MVLHSDVVFVYINSSVDERANIAPLGAAGHKQTHEQTLPSARMSANKHYFDMSVIILAT